MDIKINNYLNKLKDPRWQKKRLEILKRDNFCCQACFESKKTLHVHHIVYGSKKDPWDYDESDLITLCEECHKLWHLIFDLPYDPNHILLVVKLWDRIETEEINKFLLKNN